MDNVWDVLGGVVDWYWYKFTILTPETKQNKIYTLTCCIDFYLVVKDRNVCRSQKSNRQGFKRAAINVGIDLRVNERQYHSELGELILWSEYLTHLIPFDTSIVFNSLQML